MLGKACIKERFGGGGKQYVLVMWKGGKKWLFSLGSKSSLVALNFLRFKVPLV